MYLPGSLGVVGSASDAEGWTQELLALAELLRCAALEATDPQRQHLPQGSRNHADAHMDVLKNWSRLLVGMTGSMFTLMIGRVS